MAFEYDFLMGTELETRQTLTERDVMLYALGVGVAAQRPLDRTELQFVYEDSLVALPTMFAVMAYPGFWIKDPKYGVDWRRILHGEQSIRIHAPVPTSGELVGKTKVNEIYDKGTDKGAIMYSSREIYDVPSGRLLATVMQSSFLRGDGGFGGKSTGAPAPFPTPDRSPDLSISLPTRDDQALLYRLSGDFNPVHADPEVAGQAGFEKPILHGLCTYGFAGRAAIALLCDNDPSRLKRLDVRFSSPVYPGETLQFDFWNEGAGRAAMTARVVERGIDVLRNGLVEFE